MVAFPDVGALTPAEIRRHAAEFYLPQLGIDLSPEFRAALLPRPPIKAISGGWRAGKSSLLACDVQLDLPFIQRGRDYRYWGIMPSYKTPPKEMQYLARWNRQTGMLTRESFPDEKAVRIELLGGQVVIETRTAQDPEGIASDACDGIFISEPGQMPEILFSQAQGRLMDRHGWLDMGGTLEDDEAHPRWVWFGKRMQEWLDVPDPDRLAFSLPSWANLTLFPGGRDDEEIKRRERSLPPQEFARKIAGIPTGVADPIYGQLLVGEMAAWQYRGVGQLAVRGDADADRHGWLTWRGAGGSDYGSGGARGHPSVLAIVTVDRADVAVVREVWRYQGLDRALIETKRRLLSQKYHVPSHRWMLDPMQKQAAEIAGVRAAKSGKGSRFERVGLVEARLNNRKLMFDFNGPGVADAFKQLQRVHRIVRFVAGHGEVYDYARTDDDDAAAIEDAIEFIDSKRTVDLWTPLPQPETVWNSAVSRTSG